MTKRYLTPTNRLINRGGKGSGHFGHAGRPGEQGGSAPSGGVGGKTILTKDNIREGLWVRDTAHPEWGDFLVGAKESGYFSVSNRGPSSSKVVREDDYAGYEVVGDLYNPDFGPRDTPPPGMNDPQERKRWQRDYDKWKSGKLQAEVDSLRAQHAEAEAELSAARAQSIDMVRDRLNSGEFSTVMDAVDAVYAELGINALEVAAGKLSGRLRRVEGLLNHGNQYYK